jgi:hypothetical protein
MARGAKLEAKRLAMEECSRERPRCPWRPDTCTRFRKHGAVLRSVILVVDDEASVIWMRLMRWWCDCGRTFRHYPPDLLPYKRYLHGEILDRVGRMVGAGGGSCFAVAGVAYVAADASSGASVSAATSSADAPVVARESATVAQAEAAEESASFMASSTPWRWVGWLGSMFKKMAPEWSRWLSRQSDFKPEAWPIPECRTPQRKAIWSACLKVLLTLGRFTTDFAMPAPGS